MLCCARQSHLCPRNAVGILAALAFLIFIRTAAADTIHFNASGTLISDMTAVDVPTDPVITAAHPINVGDAWSLTLTYATGGFAGATLQLSFDGYSFSYDAGAGDTIALFSNTASLPGLTLLQACTSAGCGDNFLNLYFTGVVTSPDTLGTDASGLAGDKAASPTPFEFLRNFASDGGQTDLQGSIGSIASSGGGGGSTVPEPDAVWLWLGALVALTLATALRRRLKTEN